MLDKIPQKPFYFVRHGQTDWNKLKLFQGASDIPLNNTGIEQALFLARILKKEPIAHIVSSPLSRAKRTTEIINEHLLKPLTIIEELRETSLKEIEGKPIDDDFFDKWILGHVPKDSESVSDFDARVASGLIKALSLSPPTLIVSHGGVFGSIQRTLKLPRMMLDNCQAVYYEPTLSKDIPWICTIID